LNKSDTNIIIGAGIAGSTLARLFAENGEKVLVIEKRNHIAGNLYDFTDENGILVQKYGPHIFHTNNEKVWEFLSRFTEWNDYVHKVLANVDEKIVPLPINIDTVNILYGTNYTEENIQEFFDQNKITCEKIENSRDVVLSKVGEDLYNKLIKNYTKKQWGVYPEELLPEVLERLPVRTNHDWRYFSDKYQGMPVQGFTKMIEKILDYSNIEVSLNTEFRNDDDLEYKRLIFTGCIDEFFEHKFGKLPYRSLKFESETINKEFYQEGAVVNYPNDFEFTRITEFKHWTYQKCDKTSIMKEFPLSEGDPYYPVPARENQELYAKYAEEAKRLENVYFTGRLGKYKYQNIDTVAGDSIELFEVLKGK
jgi:UDP-galactopyranose mutase